MQQLCVWPMAVVGPFQEYCFGHHSSSQMRLMHTPLRKFRLIPSSSYVIRGQTLARPNRRKTVSFVIPVLTEDIKVPTETLCASGILQTEHVSSVISRIIFSKNIHYFGPLTS
jgi:hypothetical protein